MQFYLYGNSVLTEGQMHTVWMQLENRPCNFSKWLKEQQKIS